MGGWARALGPACLAVVGHCGRSFSPAGPLAARLLAPLLYAAIFLLVLLSGDATRCHLPASLQWLSWACLPRAWVVWKEEGGELWARLGPFETRPSGPGTGQEYGVLPGTKRSTFT